MNKETGEIKVFDNEEDLQEALMPKCS